MKILVFDLVSVFEFLRSCAVAKAVESQVRLRWNPHIATSSGEAFFNWFFGLGLVEIEVGDLNIQRETNEEALHLMAIFLEKTTHGPAPAIDFLVLYDGLRKSCIDFVRSQFAEAAQTNREIASRAGDTVENLALIKLGADLLMGSPFAPFAISLPYSVATSFIKELSMGRSAGMVALGTAAGATPDVLGEGGSAIANAMKKEHSRTLYLWGQLGERAAPHLPRSMAIMRTIGTIGSGVSRIVPVWSHFQAVQEFIDTVNQANG